MEQKGKIAVQMMMLKNEVAEQGAFAVLEKLHGMGYRCFEISQIPMTEENVAGMEKAIRELGSEIPALSAALAPPTPDAPGDFITRDYDKLVADARRLGAAYLRIGSMPGEAMMSYEAQVDYARAVNQAAEKLRRDGISLYLHNHHLEFAKINGKYILDIFRENAPQAGLELDVHWIQRGGENPVKIVRQHAGAIDLLHLKDYKMGWDSRADMPDKATRFAEIGEGNLPMQDIIQAGLEGGSKYFIIEQDECYTRTAYESLALSRKNLCEMGYEGWF